MPSKPALAARSIMDSSCIIDVPNISRINSPNTTPHTPNLHRNYSDLFALAPPAAAGWGRKAGTPRTPPRGLAGPLGLPTESGLLQDRKTTRAGGSAEGDRPLPEREGSSLHPSCPPPAAATREFATALPTESLPLDKLIAISYIEYSR